MVFKALHGQAPIYISELLQPVVPTRTLRSSSDTLQLIVPRTRLKSYGDRAFSAIGPKLWNQTPLHYRQSENLDVFKQRLKTHLFLQHFDD